MLKRQGQWSYRNSDSVFILSKFINEEEEKYDIF